MFAILLYSILWICCQQEEPDIQNTRFSDKEKGSTIQKLSFNRQSFDPPNLKCYANCGYGWCITRYYIIPPWKTLAWKRRTKVSFIKHRGQQWSMFQNTCAFLKSHYRIDVLKWRHLTQLPQLRLLDLTFACPEREREKKKQRRKHIHLFRIYLFISFLLFPVITEHTQPHAQPHRLTIY